MNLDLNVTFSKFTALVITVLAFVLDLKNGGGTVFMYAVPFVSFIITGKQFLDMKELKNESGKNHSKNMGKNPDL